MSKQKKLPAVVENAVVAIYYTLKDDAGEVLDTNRKGGQPLVFLQGKGHIVKGLEAAMLGKAKDESFAVSIPPAEGYGERDEQAMQTVPRSAFPEGAELEVGARFVARNNLGQNIPAEITAIEGDEVTVDHNHPLAGQTLNFEITVAGIREASAEELEHGHAHGPGGHHH